MELWRTHLPYCLKELKNGYWILLNRLYKPIGVTDGWKHVDYETHESKFKFSRRPKLPFTENSNGLSYHFYRDITGPLTKEYFKRIEKVYSRIIK